MQRDRQQNGPPRSVDRGHDVLRVGGGPRCQVPRRPSYASADLHGSAAPCQKPEDSAVGPGFLPLLRPSWSGATDAPLRPADSVRLTHATGLKWNRRGAHCDDPAGLSSRAPAIMMAGPAWPYSPGLRGFHHEETRSPSASCPSSPSCWPSGPLRPPPRRPGPTRAHGLLHAQGHPKEAAEKFVASCQKYLAGHAGTVSFSFGTIAEDVDEPVCVRDFDVPCTSSSEDKAARDTYLNIPAHAVRRGEQGVTSPRSGSSTPTWRRRSADGLPASPRRLGPAGDDLPGGRSLPPRARPRRMARCDEGRGGRTSGWGWWIGAAGGRGAERTVEIGMRGGAGGATLGPSAREAAPIGSGAGPAASAWAAASTADRVTSSATRSRRVWGPIGYLLMALSRSRPTFSPGPGGLTASLASWIAPLTSRPPAGRAPSFRNRPGRRPTRARGRRVPRTGSFLPCSSGSPLENAGGRGGPEGHSDPLGETEPRDRRMTRGCPSCLPEGFGGLETRRRQASRPPAERLGFSALFPAAPQTASGH